MTTLANRPQQRLETTAPAGAKVVVLRATQGEVDLRTLFDTPPDLRLDIGPYCPLDDVVLVTTRPAGLACPECLAAWPLDGRGGRWVDTVPGLPRTAVGRTARVAGIAAALLAGPGAAVYVTAQEYGAVLDGVPELAIWTTTAGALAATAAGFAANWIVRRGEVA